jgi:hypothetical protein
MYQPQNHTITPPRRDEHGRKYYHPIQVCTECHAHIGHILPSSTGCEMCDQAMSDAHDEYMADRYAEWGNETEEDDDED